MNESLSGLWAHHLSVEQNKVAGTMETRSVSLSMLGREEWRECH